MRAGDGMVVLGDDEVCAGGAAVRARVEAGVAGDGEARSGGREGVEGAFGEESGEVSEVVFDLQLGRFNEGGCGGVTV